MGEWQRGKLHTVAPRRESSGSLAVAVVEDDPDHAQLAKEALEERGHHVVHFASAAEVLAAAPAETWDCIVLDYRLPDKTGLEALADLLQLPDPVPVVMVTASGSESVAVAALKNGASDYVVKTGTHSAELARAVELAAAKRRIDDMAALYQRELERRANTDALTDLMNRHRLKDVMSMVAMHAVQRGEPYAVAMIDVDGFKDINDKRGHTVGDTVLIEVARVIQSCVRQEDIVARYGGDEFVVVMPGATRSSRRGLSDRLHSALRANVAGERLGLQLDVSIGMADSAYGDPEEVLKAADQAMYRSKNRQRLNRRRHA